MKKLFSFLLIFLTIGSINLFAQKVEQPKSQFFIENKGQWDNQVQYLARLNGLNLWVTNSGVVYDYFQVKVDNNVILKTGEPNPNFGINKIWGHVISSTFLNINEHFTTQVFNKNQAYYNYFIGNDPKKWASFVPLYGSVQLNNIYNGIDVKYYYDNNLVRYDWIIHPNGDPSKIRIKFEGQDKMHISPDGDLVLETTLGKVEHSKILAYQMQEGTQRIIECKFKDEGNGIVSFELGNYNTNKDLIIDPLVYSTFLGGENVDWATGIGIDNDLNTYITGSTASIAFPISNGPYQKTLAGNSDAYITKINSNASAMIFSTFLGGSNDDHCNKIVIDSFGNSYVTGYTYSDDFPTTESAWDRTYNDTTDIIVAKLNSTGSSLIYSTYLGGMSWDNGTDIAVDKFGCAYITGYTYSKNFPITNGALETVYNDSVDAFISKLNAEGTSLIYSTFLGGRSYDVGYGIYVDSIENVYVSGVTGSDNFPTTQGCLKSKNTKRDFFISKINLEDNKLIYSTYLGGESDDYCYAITVDDKGCAYVTGYTLSKNFPVSEGSFARSSTGDYDAVITKLNQSGSSIIYSTYLGGSKYEVGSCIAIDEKGDAIIGGWTTSRDFPVSEDAFCSEYCGLFFVDESRDAFLTILSPDATHLLYSTYLGGIDEDEICDLCFDQGCVFITGSTGSYNFPITSESDVG
ncbi:MAG TPA: SBBP repeat-containing protein [Bacteroidota bacterium]|nr:SBBP repeat-containing protein [Bacteroidota bacterium]